MNLINTKGKLRERFRGFLPVIVDIETAGVDPKSNALLEMCVVLITMDDDGFFSLAEHHFEHILPFEGAKLDQKSLDFNKIDPFQPLRFAVEEQEALTRLFKPIKQAVKQSGCQRAVLVGHNAWFDLLFLNAAIGRTGIKSPFHAFTSFDTATLSGLVYGQTVLAKACMAAKINFDAHSAHSAIYDALKTAELFCKIMNQWQELVKES